MSLTSSCPRCRRRRGGEAIQADLGIRYSACGECKDAGWPPSPEPDAGRVWPWTPWQIAAVSVVFAVGACGLAAGSKFVRLAKRHSLIPAVIVGLVLFVAVAGLVATLAEMQHVGFASAAALAADRPTPDAQAAAPPA